MRRYIYSAALAAVLGLGSTLAFAAEGDEQAAAEQIATILRDSGKMKNYSVGVKYKSGTVWLNGRVTSQQQMKAALDVVSDIGGVQQIVNGLEVAPAGNGVKQPGSNQALKASANMPAQQAMGPGPDMGYSDVAPTGYNHAMRKAALHPGRPLPQYAPSMGSPNPPAMDQAHMPNYAWPSYAAYPNYAALTYPKQYSASAFPFIGPFYPYPQVPLGWRKVSLEWDDGWWFLDFQDRGHH